MNAVRDGSDIPIIIMAFNRPGYLAEVCQSLRDQKDTDLARRPVYLFQDGARNPFSGAEYCKPADIAANIDAFRRAFPEGTVMAAPANLGIALNFERAERFAFEQLAAPAAVFLEDDLVLGPYYLKALDTLLGFALDDPRIGYVAAYGNHHESDQAQRASASRLIHMSHNWGFGLTRRQWLRQKPLVEAYLALVREQDYRRRPRDPIIDLFHQWGLGASGTSQDIAKSHACYLTGAARVCTLACYGRYIGREGVHFSGAHFEAAGYDRATMIEEDLFRPVPPDTQQLWHLLDAGRQSQLGDELAREVERPGLPRPSGAPAAHTRVRWLIEQHRLDEAETLAVEWQARAPFHRDAALRPAFLHERLRIALARGRWDHARHLADRLGAEIPPTDPAVHVLFARAYARAGNTIAALAEWQATLLLQPGHPEANAAMPRAAA